jgi:Domain of unknown function (DUF6438)
MRFPLLVFVLTLLVGGGSCKMNEHSVSGGHTYGSTSDALFFSLERTPCFGKCPAYTVTIDKLGKATWVGRSNAERMGTWSAPVDPATMEKLLLHAKNVGFFAFEDKYDGQVTDLPSTIIRVNADGHDKKVFGRYKTPPAFRPFAAFADSLLAPLQWSKLALDQ